MQQGSVYARLHDAARLLGVDVKATVGHASNSIFLRSTLTNAKKGKEHALRVAKLTNSGLAFASDASQLDVAMFARISIVMEMLCCAFLVRKNIMTLK